jgi:hypothetical protein
MVDHNIREDNLRIIIYHIHLRPIIMVGEDNGSNNNNSNEIGIIIINIHPNNHTIRISHHQVHHGGTTRNRGFLLRIIWGEEDGVMDEEMDLDEEDEDLDRLNSTFNNGEIHVGEAGVADAGEKSGKVQEPSQ